MPLAAQVFRHRHCVRDSFHSNPRSHKQDRSWANCRWRCPDPLRVLISETLSNAPSENRDGVQGAPIAVMASDGISWRPALENPTAAPASLLLGDVQLRDHSIGITSRFAVMREQSRDTQTIFVPTVSFASYRFGTMGIRSGRRQERVRATFRGTAHARAPTPELGCHRKLSMTCEAEFATLPGTITRHGKNSKEETIWAA